MMKRALAILCGSISVCLAEATDAPKDAAPAAKPPKTKEDATIYGFARVLNAHLSFRAEDWKSLQPPESAGRGGFGGPGGPGGQGGPRNPGGPGGFSPGGML